MRTAGMHLTFLRCNASVRSCRWQVLQVSSEKNLGATVRKFDTTKNA